MFVNRIVTDAQNQNWVAVIADLLIVVIGLFTGLQVDSWWQSYQDSSQARIYLQELQEDFSGNRELLLGALEQGELIINDMIELSNQALLDTPSLPVTDLDEKFSSVQSMQTFSAISSAYDNLVSSSELGILKNRDLKNILADYYSLAELAELIQSTHELQLVQTFQPYMREHLEVARVMVTWQEEGEFELPEPKPDSGLLEVINTQLFRNIVTDKYYSAIDLYFTHEELQEINDEALALIEAELNQ